jgi:adenylate cyclase
MKWRKSLYLLIPLVVATLFSLLGLFRFYKIAESKIFDFLLHVKPAAPEDRRLLLVDIEDLAIARVGVWPWSRNIMADGLIVMKEMGVDRVVFDIEYIETSPLGVRASVMNEEIPELLTQEFSLVNENVANLFAALQSGDIPLEDAGSFVEDLAGFTLGSRDLIADKIRDIARDNDDYLGKAARLFGNAYFTVTMLDDPDETVAEDLRRYTEENIGLDNIEVAPSAVKVAGDIKPAILTILREAKGAGFPNVLVDDDGVRRRIDLITEYEGTYYPQLSFSALLDWLGNPKIIVRKNRILLEGARMPDGQQKDIAIPLDRKSHLIVNWPKKSYLESFRHISFYEMVHHDALENDLLHNLGLMEQAGYLAYYRGEVTELLTPYRFAEGIRNDILAGADVQNMQDYGEARALFFDEAGGFLHGDAEKAILSDLEALLSDSGLSDETRKQIEEIKPEVPRSFKETREIYDTLLALRVRLNEELRGAFAIVGHTGTSTTDIGVTPFEKEYMNLGIHAAVVNTILSGKFLDQLPSWVSILAAFLIALALTPLIRRLSPVPSILIGAGILVVFVSAVAAVFALYGTYLYLLTPSLSIFFTLVILTISKLLATAREKVFLRNAFSHYLSSTVIDELLTDPEKLNLGGEKKHLTAYFTDVRGFSTISESLDPNDLVTLLNAYLTEMSNIILDLKGTIDKFEGDAILSFFGAPIELEDHARRACLCATQMKRVETELNRRFLGDKMSPAPLFTRIGINTGEMVVGNMGTVKKMDYTVMGNSVNFASRLEGVNKQYGTWVLIGDDTFKEAGGDFTVRQLDRVRVIGLRTPVRIYELIDEKSQTPARLLEAMEVFHNALEMFELKNWDGARKGFEEVMRIAPNDGPSEVFLRRCASYSDKPPPESWDGVFNLPTK